MKDDRRTTPVHGSTWVAFLLASVATVAASPAIQTSMTDAKVASLQQQVLALNEDLEVLARTSTLKTGSPGAAEVEALLRQRAGMLEQVMRRDPAAALELALAPATRTALAARATEAGAALDSTGEWEGQLEVVAVDDLSFGEDRILYYLSGADGTVEVCFAPGAPPPTSRRSVSVKGLRLGDLVAATSWQSTESGRADAAPCSAIGEQRVAVLLVSLPSRPLPSSITDEMLQQTYFGAGPSLDGFLRESSSGRAWAAGEVVGRFTLEADYLGQPTAVRDAAVRLASRTVDLRPFNRIALVVPQASTGLTSGGLGTFGCTEIPIEPTGHVVASTTWLGDASMGSDSYRVTAAIHEMGHNLGLAHARAVDFGGEPLGPVGQLPTPWDYLREYGDGFSNMGRELGQWAAPHKLLLGWLESGTGVLTVEFGGTFVLPPYEGGTGGVKALRVRRGAGNDAFLWLENRQPLGSYDSTLPAAAFTGATVHYEDAGWEARAAYTNLLRFTADEERGRFFGNAPLAAGSAWTDPYSNLSLGVERVADGGLEVSVMYAPPPVCPGSLSPGSLRFAPAGGSAGIDVTAPVGCSWAATASVPWITIGTGAAGTGSGRVTIAVDASSVTADRWGRVVVGAAAAVVVQAGVAGGATVSPAEAVFPASGGMGELLVSTNAPDYAWGYSSTVPWIQSLSCSKVHVVGSASLRYTVAENTGAAPRSGTITAGGQTATVRQTGGGPAVSQLAWHQLSPPDTPLARLCMDMAPFPDRGEAVLYGGGADGTQFTDTWVWDGSQWTSKSPAHSPGTLCGHAMAYDAARGRVLLFGGYDAAASRYSDETWSWDGVDWTRLEPPASPLGRASHAMASDPVAGKILLFGGANSMDDTWEWDGSTWTERRGGEAPPGRFGHAMAYDAARDEIVLFGGARDLYSGSTAPVFFSDTWVWDGSAWQQRQSLVSPSPGYGHRIAYDPELGRVILIGGAGGKEVALSPPFSYGLDLREETWSWNGTSWSQLFPEKSPEFSYTYGLFHDEAHGAFTAYLGDDLHCAARGPKTYVLTPGPGAVLLEPYRVELPAAGGQGTVAVTAGVPWAAATGESWLTIVLGQHGIGDGAVTYEVAANAGTARQGTVWIGRQPLVVHQTDGGGGLQASFTFNPASPAVGAVITFSDTSTGGATSWRWDFGDGTGSTSQSPTHGFTRPGTYTVSLTVFGPSATSTSARSISLGWRPRRHI
jgi:hypothetical protein